MRILLTGPSAAGKTTLAKALAHRLGLAYVSTSDRLRARVAPSLSVTQLLVAGDSLDQTDPTWFVRDVPTHAVVDALRNDFQVNLFRAQSVPCLVVNVEAPLAQRERRGSHRGRPVSTQDVYCWHRPRFTWHSDLQPLGEAVTAVGRCLGALPPIDVLLGAQYGSEGKGKWAALMAPVYDYLVRSGGPNAGHWVREGEAGPWGEPYEVCYHHLPSGTRSNPNAQLLIAAGATVAPSIITELDLHLAWNRTYFDRKVMPILPSDSAVEGKLVRSIGSTGQGVGQAAIRRLQREDMTLGQSNDVWNGVQELMSAFGSEAMSSFKFTDVARTIADRTGPVLVEGTQGSGLSLFHGPYPYCTSRDTNVSGLLSECGIAPHEVGEVALVVRPYPIRTGGNSGPLARELTWAEVAARCGQDPTEVAVRELTSTTKRQRRVGEFEEDQFEQAVRLNRPTCLFLSFADYLDPGATGLVGRGLTLPGPVVEFINRLERLAGCPVVGVSTGRMQSEVVWR